jgi:hypothetical protein
MFHGFSVFLVSCFGLVGYLGWFAESIAMQCYQRAARVSKQPAKALT